MRFFAFLLAGLAACTPSSGPSTDAAPTDDAATMGDMQVDAAAPLDMQVDAAAPLDMLVDAAAPMDMQVDAAAPLDMQVDAAAPMDMQVDAAAPLDMLVDAAELPDMIVDAAEPPDMIVDAAELPDMTVELPDMIVDAELPVNTAPEAQDDAVRTPQTAEIRIEPLANDADPEGDPVALVAVGDPAHGAVVRDGAVITYVPDGVYFGDDRFEYTIADPQGLTARAQVVVTVMAPPIAQADLFEVPQDQAQVLAPLENDSDPESGLLQVTILMPPTHGQLAEDGDARFRYTPAPGYYGADGFTYRITDSDGLTAEAAASIQVIEDPLERAIRTGDVAQVSEDDLLAGMRATNAETRTTHQSRWRSIFNLNPDDAPTADTPRAIQWNPSHDSVQLFIADTARATSILVSDGAAKHPQTQNRTLALVGQHANDSRYAVFGANPFHDLMRANQPGGSGNADLSAVLSSTIRWVTRDAAPARIVIAHTTDSHYFRHDDTTPLWFAEHLPDADVSGEDTCEINALAGCLADADLLIISQDVAEQETNVDVVMAAVQAAQDAGLPVIYVQAYRELTPLGERLMAYFGVTTANNYWRQEQLVAVDPIPTPAFDSLDGFIETLAEETLAYADYEACVGNAKAVRGCNAPGFVEKLMGVLRAQNAVLNAFNERGEPLFDQPGYRVLKILALLGDRYRIGGPNRAALDYPIRWQDNPANFARAIVADHTVLYPRAINPAQPDLGTFVCPNGAYAAGECTGYDIDAAPRAERHVIQVVPPATEWTTTGAYILPGHTITATRTDNVDVEIALRFNSHWSDSTRSFEQSRGRSKYDRPQYLSSPYIRLEPGQPVTLTSPYGGAIYVQVKGDADTAGEIVTVDIDNAGQHAALLDLADEAAIADFLAEVRENPIPYVDLRSTGFESHLRKDRFINPADTLYDGNLPNLFHDYREHFVGTTYRLAGFAAPGATVEAGLSDDVLALCGAMNWDCIDPTLHRRDRIQHANFDGSSRCGAGCSGNPFDGNWDLDPIGWGNAHELGHNLQVKPLRIAWMRPEHRNDWSAWADRAVENSNNVFPYYVRWRYERVVLDNDAEYPEGHMNQKDLFAIIQSDLAALTRMVDGVPERVVYDARCRVQGTGAADADNLRIDAVLADGGYAADNGIRMSFYLQLPLWFHQRPLADGVALANGFDIIPLLYAQQRVFRAAARDAASWDAARADLGFPLFAYDGDPTYGGGRVRDIWANDFMLVALSYISGWDFRPYFDLRGIPYSDLAERQVEQHIATDRVSATVSNEFAVLETDLPHRDLIVDWVPLDGVTAWPRDGFHPRDCLP